MAIDLKSTVSITAPAWMWVLLAGRLMGDGDSAIRPIVDKIFWDVIQP
jgi:hypothetical protein